MKFYLRCSWHLSSVTFCIAAPSSISFLFHASLHLFGKLIPCTKEYLHEISQLADLSFLLFLSLSLVFKPPCTVMLTFSLSVSASQMFWGGKFFLVLGRVLAPWISNVQMVHANTHQVYLMFRWHTNKNFFFKLSLVFSCTSTQCTTGKLLGIGILLHVLLHSSLWPVPPSSPEYHHLVTAPCNRWSPRSVKHLLSEFSPMSVVSSL